MRAYTVTYTSVQSQKEFLSFLGSEVENGITKEIKDVDVFSIMADTTPDASKKDQMSVKKVRDKAREEHASAAIRSVDNKDLDNTSIAFQSYDFTNSTSGKYNDIQAIVSQQLYREVPYIPCQGHRSDTINEHACAASLILELFDTLQTAYAFFSSSTKRHSL